MSLISVSRSVPAEWMFRAKSTCFGDQVAAGVLGQLLAEDQDRVERRAQLVRHVGEELRLVLRGQRQLGRLLLERAARLLDFLVLALDLDVLLGELLAPSSASSSLVCCSSVCRVCSSMVSCCDCCSRFSVRIVASIVFSTTPIDCVSCSRKVRWVGGERLQRRQLDDRLGLALEQHRQHDDVLGPRARRGSSGPWRSCAAPW